MGNVFSPSMKDLSIHIKSCLLLTNREKSFLLTSYTEKIHLHSLTSQKPISKQTAVQGSEDSFPRSLRQILCREECGMYGFWSTKEVIFLIMRIIWHDPRQNQWATVNSRFIRLLGWAL